MRERDGIEALTDAIGRYNDAWNSQDLDAIMGMHAPDMVFANHTAGESAEGEDGARAHRRIFEAWPDMEFATRRLYVRDELVVQEWTATAAHSSTMRRGDLEAPASGKTVNGTGWTRSRSSTGSSSARTSTRTRSRSCARSACSTELHPVNGAPWALAIRPRTPEVRNRESMIVCVNPVKEDE